SSTWLVSAVLWAWWRMHRRRRARDVVVVVVLLVALVFASQEYAMMALSLLALDSAARVVAPGPFGVPPPWWPGLVGAWAGLGVVVGSIALVALGSPAQPLPERAVFHGSGFLLAFVRPPWLFPMDMFRFWFVMYLGTAPLALLVATARYTRRAGYW